MSSGAKLDCFAGQPVRPYFPIHKFENISFKREWRGLVRVLWGGAPTPWRSALFRSFEAVMGHMCWAIDGSWLLWLFLYYIEMDLPHQWSAQHSILLQFSLWFIFFIRNLVSWPKVEVYWVFDYLGLECTSDAGNWNWTTCCSYRTEKWQLTEDNLVVVAELILWSGTETCKLDFSGCPVSWSRETLNLQLVSSGSLLGAGGDGSCLFVHMIGNWVPPLTWSVFDIS